MVSTQYRGVNHEKNISEIMQKYKPATVFKQELANKQYNLKLLKDRHVQHGKGKPYGVIKNFVSN